MSYKKKFLYRPFYGELPLKQATPKIGFKLDFEFVTNENYDIVIQELSNINDPVSLDTETTGLEFSWLDLVCVSFSIKINFNQIKNYVFICKHNNYEIVLTLEQQQNLINNIFSHKDVFLFNSFYDLRVIKSQLKLDIFKYHGNFVDAQKLVFLADTNVSFPALKTSAEFFNGYPAVTFDFNNIDILESDIQTLGYYSAHDAFITLELGTLLLPIMQKYYPFIVALDRKIICPLIHFEDEKLSLDRDYLEIIREEAVQISEEIKETIWKYFGEFNLNSSQQTAKVFKEKGIDTGVLTETGNMSVSIKVLEKMVDIPILKDIIQYKKLVKLISSYINPLTFRLDHLLPARFHYIETRVPTYRLAAGSSGKKKKKEKNLGYFCDLNIQSFPKPYIINREMDFDFNTFIPTFRENGKYLVESGSPKLNLRKCLIAPEDYTWVSVDYVAQELKVAAFYSKEPLWMNSFRNKEDLHANVAKELWGIENYNKNLRKKAKIANFSLLYLGTYKTLMEKLNISEEEAIPFEKRYRETHPTLYAWKDKIISVGRKQGYVINFFGLPRRIGTYYRSMQKGLINFADRTSVNTVIQSVGGILIRIDLIKLYRVIEEKYKDKVFFRSTVHDEVNFICHRSYFYEFCKDLHDIMISSSHPKWEFPLEVEFSIGKNWGELFVINFNKDFTSFEIKEEERKEIDTKMDITVSDILETVLDEDNEENSE